MTEAETEPRFDDPFARSLRGFGPLGILVILAVLFVGSVPLAPLVAFPLSAVIVLLWVWRSGTPWRALGFVRPERWPLTVAAAFVLGGAFKVLMKAIVMPLLGADPVNRTYHFLAGNTAMLPRAIYLMIVVAGFGEETFYRGFLFERLGKLLGGGTAAKAAIVLVTAAWFGIGHYADQRLAGAEQATIVGLVFGAFFARTGRVIPLMIAHASFDLTALAMIYWDIEADVAHLVFG